MSDEEATEAPAPSIHPKLAAPLAAYLTEHRDRIRQANRDLNDAARPLHQLCADARRLALDLDTALQDAKMQDHDLMHDNRIEFMHTRIKEIDDAARAINAAYKQLTRGLAALVVQHDASHDDFARTIEANPR